MDSHGRYQARHNQSLLLQLTEKGFVFKGSTKKPSLQPRCSGSDVILAVL